MYGQVGTWLSLVEHRVRDAGVGGSNPLVPTISNSETWFEKYSILFKIKKDDNFNHMNTLSISRIKIRA